MIIKRPNEDHRIASVVTSRVIDCWCWCFYIVAKI